jgi:amino-acid N-acetyltransferase
MVRDGMVIACAALFPFEDSHTGEIACVAVHPDYRGSARAATLLNRLEGEAKLNNLRRLFSLTTHTPHWFVERGFTQGKIEDLPMQKQRLYNYQRNSLVLFKNL